MAKVPPASAVLLLIDLQRAITHPCWGARNNPTAERNIADLLHHWRSLSRPLIHIRHDSLSPTSYYRPGQPLHDFLPLLAPLPRESVVAKWTNSAFIGGQLEAALRGLGSRALVVVGVITNNSVEATVRMAGNLGYDTWLVEDACWTFARRDWSGVQRSAEEVHAMSLANMDGEYCTVTTTAAVLEQTEASRDER